ncbi:hypothetical protein MSAN_01253000 [Mycena sanguinolenta]|uniref:Uncharacterized protein n=1 Tax=Mycena sanguinolenta TaxID=230812 RepID=A0A8H6YDJ3_9AGAR|nr:hypothetical protein MSAN_01253000 [Mycena sanguinolenta]
MPQVISNRTIDDQFGDPVSGLVPSYSPSSFWKEGASCGSGCAVHPDPTLAFNHTWHDSSQFPNEAPVSVSLQFTGTAVWVFCIVPPLTENVITSYNLNFTLDNGKQQGTFSYTPTSSSDFLFNVPVVSLPTLANTAHTLVIATDDSVDGSIFLFDYAVYTSVEDDTPQSTAKDTQPNTGTIAGCVLGGIFLFVLVLALLRCRNRRRTKKPPILPVIEPFPKSPAVDSGSTTLAPETVDLSRNPSTHSPSTLIHQLRQALDTAVALRQTPASQSSPQSPSSGIQVARFCFGGST